MRKTWEIKLSIFNWSWT